MIKEKIVYVTEDGSQFDTKEAAQRYDTDEKVKEDLISFILGKDLRGSKVDTISEFVTENAKELYAILSPMFEEI